MKHLIAEFTAKPGCSSRVIDLLEALATRVRDEPGNVTFDPFERVDRSGSFIVVEAYRDEKAFTEHIESDHSRRFNAELSDLIQGGASNLVWLRPCRPPT